MHEWKAIIFRLGSFFAYFECRRRRWPNGTLSKHAGKRFRFENGRPKFGGFLAVKRGAQKLLILGVFTTTRELSAHVSLEQNEP